MNTQRLIQVLTCAWLLSGFSTVPAYSQTKPTSPKPEAGQNPSTVDLAKVTCRSVLQMSDEDRAYTLIFFHGYMSGRNRENLIDTAQLYTITGRIADACTARPETPLIQVFTQFRSTAQK